MLPPMQVTILKSRCAAPQLSRKQLLRAAVGQLRRRGPWLPAPEPPSRPQVTPPSAAAAAWPRQPELPRAADAALARMEVKAVQILDGLFRLFGLA
mmetsp:Transcript_4859/g.15673  ORF Transcript_4859/g.15673 Transcript_4859/m.15673 type:complete len:96 (+) Transcript_4859:72-359(+)